MVIRGRFPIMLDPAGATEALIVSNTRTLTAHYPGPDGRCPGCGVELCEPRLRAVKDLRAAGVMVPVLPPHEPSRSAWWCEPCDCDWPCSQARVMLGDLFETDRSGLARRMARLLVEAARELPAVPVDELATRFVGWVTY